MEQSVDSLKVNHNDSEESKTDSQVFEVGIQLGTFIPFKGKTNSVIFNIFKNFNI